MCENDLYEMIVSRNFQELGEIHSFSGLFKTSSAAVIVHLNVGRTRAKGFSIYQLAFFFLTRILSDLRLHDHIPTHPTVVIVGVYKAAQ